MQYDFEKSFMNIMDVSCLGFTYDAEIASFIWMTLAGVACNAEIASFIWMDFVNA